MNFSLQRAPVTFLFSELSTDSLAMSSEFFGIAPPPADHGIATLLFTRRCVWSILNRFAAYGGLISRKQTSEDFFKILEFKSSSGSEAQFLSKILVLPVSAQGTSLTHL